MTDQDLKEYRKAQEIAFVAMGIYKRPVRGRGARSRWIANDDPLAHHELTELIFGFRTRAALAAMEGE